MWQSDEKARFLAVGLYNTVVGYVVFAGIYLWLNGVLPLWLIQLLAHLVAVSNAFLGYKYIVFRTTGHLLIEFIRFNATYTAVLLFSLIAMPFMVQRLDIHPLYSQVILIFVTMIASFLLHKRISFQRGT